MMDYIGSVILGNRLKCFSVCIITVKLNKNFLALFLKCKILQTHVALNMDSCLRLLYGEQKWGTDHCSRRTKLRIAGLSLAGLVLYFGFYQGWWKTLYWVQCLEFMDRIHAEEPRRQEKGVLREELKVGCLMIIYFVFFVLVNWAGVRLCKFVGLNDLN